MTIIGVCCEPYLPPDPSLVSSLRSEVWPSSSVCKLLEPEDYAPLALERPAEHLSPSEWHEKLQHGKDLVLFDVSLLGLRLRLRNGDVKRCRERFWSFGGGIRAQETSTRRASADSRCRTPSWWTRRPCLTSRSRSFWTRSPTWSAFEAREMLVLGLRA